MEYVCMPAINIFFSKPGVLFTELYDIKCQIMLIIVVCCQALIVYNNSL